MMAEATVDQKLGTLLRLQRKFSGSWAAYRKRFSTTG